MTEFILIVCGLVFGAICLAMGYGIAKKKKIAIQVTEEISSLKDQVKELTDKIGLKI